MISATYSKDLPMYPPSSLEMKIFGISPEMRRFGGKRWEKLWIGWNWPFLVNLSLILGEKIENPAKWPNLAILTQSKQLFRPNLQLWVILSHIGVKWFEKVGKLKKVANVPPSTGMKIVGISGQSRHFGGKRCTHPPTHRVKLTIGLNHEPHFGGKDRSFQERSSSLAILTQSNPPLTPNYAIIWFYAWTGNWSEFQFKMDLWKTQKSCHPPPRIQIIYIYKL